ncbi:DUF4241 domain-containing protein [Taibaiella chishuiensis]|uniref:Uncharacterized protein DUF4241 n=1 Tax=Taibaiella chishuiensis TaxID=1434707 RepID=A0A2P8DCN0_9BACT|nr:DUF4241 domain-containing protein [Taibaiella chishuiensis]PSK94972.1 uncharacterized protein DUF4241 [Taibaiella chishuiensis]
MEQDWLKKYEAVKDILVCPTDLESYFTPGEICGAPMETMPVGDIYLPTGKLVVRDPLVTLNAGATPYLTEAPKGTFPVTIAVVKSASWGDRYAAVKVTFTAEKPAVYREALVGMENLEGLKDGDFFGFGVDAGLGCIADVEALPYFDKFFEEQQIENTYDDYFAGLFEQSFQANPRNQRKGGDWINWQIPGTDYRIPMFASGFGDGVYPVYFAYDAQDRICALYIQFIDIELEFSGAGEG